MNASNPKAKITIEVPADLKEALLAKASADDADLSKVCRKILRQHITNPPPPAPALHEKAAA